MFNDYYIAGLQGIVIGFFMGIESLILLDIISGLMRERDSFVINFIDKRLKKQKKEA